MLCSILYKVMILSDDPFGFSSHLKPGVSHPSSCKSFVTDPGSRE